MTRPLILTAAWLRQHDAFPEQVALFRRLFGESAEVCPETVTMALAAGLSVTWLGGEVLTAAAQAAYDSVTAAAWAEYRRVVDPAWAAYDRVTAPAQAEYRRVTAAAWAEYHDRVTAAAWAAYDRVTAPAMAALLADPTNWKPEVLTELRRDV